MYIGSKIEITSSDCGTLHSIASRKYKTGRETWPAIRVCVPVKKSDPKSVHSSPRQFLLSPHSTVTSEGRNRIVFHVFQLSRKAVSLLFQAYSRYKYYIFLTTTSGTHKLRYKVSKFDLSSYQRSVLGILADTINATYPFCTS